MKANQYTFIVACTLILIPFYSSAQSNVMKHKGYFSLSNYIIPTQIPAVYIGKVVPPASVKTVKVKLIKDTARIFTIRNGELYLKKNKKLTQSSPRVYGVDLLINETRVSFELIKDNFARNKVIAHRGAWKHTGAAQNTIRSFIKACEMKCRGSEFDVWLSKDNVPILAHDPMVAELSVEESTVAQLSRTQLPTGDYVPTLADFITVGKQQNTTYLVLEVKSSQKGLERSLQLADSIVSIVHQMKAQGWVEYISFNYEVLQRIRQLDQAAKISYLEGDRSVEYIYNDHLSGIDFYHYYYQQNPQLVKDAHKLGLTTNIWTVNSEEDLKKYYHSDMDYITTDEPEVLLDIEQKYK